MLNDPRDVWNGIHFKVYQQTVEISPGLHRTFEFVWRLDGTRTIAVNQNQELLITREFRCEMQQFDWRLPGGKLDYEGEPIEQAAARELREETGVIAATWKYLWSNTPDATVRFRRHFLLATDLTIERQPLGEGEYISIHWLPMTEVQKLALNGQIREEISALSLLQFAGGRIPE